MRHLKKGKKFHRLTGERKSFLRNLVSDLIRNGKVETTEARAKAIRPIAERLITHARRGDLATRRLILKRVHNKLVAGKVLNELAPSYADRPGGYLRIIKLGKSRKRDGSRLARVEFV